MKNITSKIKNVSVTFPPSSTDSGETGIDTSKYLKNVIF